MLGEGGRVRDGRVRGGGVRGGIYIYICTNTDQLCTMLLAAHTFHQMYICLTVTIL